MNITKSDKLRLQEFLKAKIPIEYKLLDEKRTEMPDLMYCHEELFDYADRLLRGIPIEANSNFVGFESDALSDKFYDLLCDIQNTNGDMKDFCLLLLETRDLIKKYAR